MDSVIDRHMCADSVCNKTAKTRLSLFTFDIICIWVKCFILCGRLWSPNIFFADISCHVMSHFQCTDNLAYHSCIMFVKLLLLLPFNHHDSCLLTHRWINGSRINYDVSKCNLLPYDSFNLI